MCTPGSPMETWYCPELGWGLPLRHAERSSGWSHTDLRLILLLHFSLPWAVCFPSSLPSYRCGWTQSLNIHHLILTFFFFKFSKSFDFCSNCACYMYICWKLAISSESHKILQEVIKVLHCKAMMRSQKVNAVLGDHGHILSHKGVGKKKCGSNLSFLLPLLSAIWLLRSQPVFKNFLVLFF